MPSRSRLKLITSSSDVTGLWPMRATSLASSIARYHFTGFYPVPVVLFSTDRLSKVSTNFSDARHRHARSSRFPYDGENREDGEERSAARRMAENAADKLGDFAYS